MLVLGPLSGWYGPSIITQVRDLLENESPTTPPIAPNLTPSSNQQRQLRLEQRQTRLRALQASFEADRQAALQRLEDRTSRMGYERNPLVNRNGTFNMRYHLPPSEQ